MRSPPWRPRRRSHGAWAESRSPTWQAARLAGQDFDYLLRLLRGFKAKTASDLDGTMTVASQPLTPEDIVSLVHFLASLGPDPTSR